MAELKEIIACMVFICVVIGIVLFATFTPGNSRGDVSFLVIGDFGGLPIFPYKTAIEEAVAIQMGKYARNHSVDFVLTLGDNFYYDGVKNVKDRRFQETYGKVFNQTSLDVDWYLIAGNHDYRGSVRAQIEYTKVLKRWQFPSFYYKLSFTVPGGKTLEILMIDTVMLCGNSDDFEDQIPLGPVSLEKADVHWQWIRDNLEASKADYLIVAGHYPVISAGLHGPTLALERRLMPMLHKNQVTAYFSGHDHNLQHLERKNRWSTVSYFVSGAANFIEVSMKHEGDIPRDVLKFHWAKKLALGGFGHVRVTDKVMTFGFYESIGKKLYEHTMLPRDLK